MADIANTLGPSGRRRSVTVGDLPESVQRRYYVDGRGGPGLGYYVDAKVQAPAFRDRGRQLAASRADPNAIRDMTAIARHRGWSVIVARGGADFRREAWLAGRSAGLDVRGYRPTERDQQELERRLTRTRRRDLAGERLDNGARARLDAVRTVVEARIASPSAQARILAAARARLAEWLERGARFEPLRPSKSAEIVTDRRRERER